MSTKRISWVERIVEATIREGFTQQDYEDSSSWNSCALGEKLNFPSQKKYGTIYVSDISGKLRSAKNNKDVFDFKIPKKVEQAGIDFNVAVRENDFAKAAKCFAIINKWNPSFE